jgi:hypothetical protein
MFYRYQAVHVPPPGIRREPKGPETQLDLSVKDELEALFRSVLRQPPSDKDTIILNIPGHMQGVTMKMIVPTAIMAFWSRPSDLELQAISLFLSGVDTDDDERVLKSFEDTIVGGRETSRPMMSQLTDMVRRQPRPAGVTVHMNERSWDTVGIRVGAGSLGTAFFDSLGLLKGE